MLPGTRLVAAALIVAVAAIPSPVPQDVSVISPKGPQQSIPQLGFGTWGLKGNATEVIASAMEVGFRHFDCATAYSNQKQIGAGIKLGLQRTGLKRQDIWITSKIWSNRHSGKVQSGIEQNLKELGLDYIDLTLMHFPIGNTNGKPEYDIVPTWKEMEKFAGTGPGKLTRFIGISNFNVPQIDQLLAGATIQPHVHQYERHPYLQDSMFRDYHRSRNLSVTAYGPLGNTNPQYRQRARAAGAPPPLLSNPLIVEIARSRSCTPAQVVLKWNLNDGVVVIPKTQQKARMRENFDAYAACKLTPEDMARIKEMERRPEWTARFWDICKASFGLPCYMGLQRE